MKTIVHRVIFWVLFATTIQAQIQHFPTEAYGDQLVIGMLRQPELQLNPFNIQNSAEKDIIRLIFGGGLIQAPDKFAAPPALIDRFIFIPGGQNNRYWRLVLKRNIFFHNDHDMRNSDVKFTFEFLKKYGGQILNRRIDFRNIAEIRIHGDLELMFVLHRPDRNFDKKFSDIPILPREYYEEAMEKGFNIFSEKPPIGIGPFVFESRTPNQIQLVTHSRYYNGRPFLDGVRIRFFDDEQQIIDGLVNGNVDYAEISDLPTAERVHEILGNRILLFTVPRSSRKIYFILLNTRKFPFEDKATRAALESILNKQLIVNRLLPNIGSVAQTLIPPDNKYYFEEAFRDQYNPGRAQVLLQQTGWQLNQQSDLLELDGQPFRFQLIFAKNSPLEESIARTLKITLGELNIDMVPVPVNPMDKDRLIQTGDFQAILCSYEFDDRALFQAVDHFYFHTLRGDVQNVNYRNRFLDKMFSVAYRDASIYPQLFKRFQFYLRRDHPVIFLFFSNRIIIAVDSRFHNVRTTYKMGDQFFYRLRPLENWFVPKELQKYHLK